MTDLDNGKRSNAYHIHADDDLMLSETGRSCRDALLVELQGAVVREGRRRRKMRQTIRSVSMAVVIIGVGITLIGIWPTSNTPIKVSSIDQPESISCIQIVETRPEAVAAMIVHPTTNLAHYYIDDRELVSTLASIGRPSGLIRRDGAVCLASDVTDPLAEPH